MKFNLLAITISGVFLLTACNLGKSPEPTQDVNAIYTNVAQTTMAQFSAQQTQTAQAVPPASPTAQATFTPLPTFPVLGGTTPLAASPGIGVTPLASPIPSGGTGGSTAVGCNDAAYVNETKPFDNAEITAGKNFTKGWQLQNTGTCAWDEGYSFAFFSGDQMGGADVYIGKNDAATDPGHSNTFIVKLQAPKDPGTYKGVWRMKDDQGNFFGAYPYVLIVVK